MLQITSKDHENWVTLTTRWLSPKIEPSVPCCAALGLHNYLVCNKTHVPSLSVHWWITSSSLFVEIGTLFTTYKWDTGAHNARCRVFLKSRASRRCGNRQLASLRMATGNWLPLGGVATSWNYCLGAVATSFTQGLFLASKSFWD